MQGLERAVDKGGHPPPYTHARAHTIAHTTTSSRPLFAPRHKGGGCGRGVDSSAGIPSVSLTNTSRTPSSAPPAHTSIGQAVRIHRPPHGHKTSCTGGSTHIAARVQRLLTSVARIRSISKNAWCSAAHHASAVCHPTANARVENTR